VESYKKDFDGWNIMKKTLDATDRKRFFYEKDVWWCSIGVNIGSEQDGKGRSLRRPVLVYKKINSRTFIGIPLTQSLKEDYAHVSFYFNYDISTAIISQIRLYDKKRLIEKVGSVSSYIQRKMKKTIIAFLS
jgi:mRNA-degrading endonuclease toxin of MazEF toxin-antitoxin module